MGAWRVGWGSGGGGGGGGDVGEAGDYKYLSLHCHHQNGFCIEVGSDLRAILMFHNCEGQSHKTVSTDHNLKFVEKGEPKQIGTEVLQLTSLTPYR